MTFNKDYAGVLFSSLCLLHCIAGPVILALGFTSLTFSFFLDEKVHLALVFPIIFFAFWSMPIGLKKHQSKLPLTLAITGVLMLLSGLMIERFEMALTFLASSMLIVAHLSNVKLLNKK